MAFFVAIFRLIVLSLAVSHSLAHSLSWTLEESEYLSAKGNIRVCIDPKWMPYEGINKHGQHDGISSEYMKSVSQRLNTPITLYPTDSWQHTLESAKNRQCDIISMARATEERQVYLNFTTPYVSFPYVIASIFQNHYMTNLKDNLDKTYAVVKGYAVNQYLKSQYPSIKILPVKNIDAGLQALRSGEAHGYIDSLLTLGYYISKYGALDIKVIGKTTFSSSVSIASRNDEPLLNQVLQKALDDLSESEIKAILDRWRTVRYEQQIDTTIVWQVIVIASIILAISIIWNRRLHHAKAKTQQALNELAKAQDELRRMAITDKLTGLYNRAKLDDTLEKEIHRADRFNHELGLLLMDVDHFKQVNDLHGHQVGDDVLLEMANILQQETRDIDTVGRWGGEEFMIICPETDLNNTRILGEKLLKRIEAHDFPIAGQKTASFGATTYRKKENLKTLIARVDSNLYQSKENGRNQIVYS
jgi:polar amino acid transport system substrate-binding protein